MKLNFITFLVRDMEKSIAFYSDMAELHLVRRFSPGAGEIAFMGNADGETELELVCFDQGEKIHATGMVLCFTCTGKLDELRHKAIALGYQPTEIVTGGPEPEHFKVADPDGVTVEFCL